MQQDDKSSAIDWWGSALVLSALLITQAQAGNTWPSFQNGGEMSLEGAVATTLGNEPAWSVELPGYGQSSPIVWDTQVYVTSVEGPNKETYHVTAYDLLDGRELWRHEVTNASPVESSNYVSKAAPSPAADADGVICFFEGGNVVSLSHRGDIRWARNLAEEYGAFGARHGLAASVEQDDDSAFLWVERAEDPFVLSVSKQTGENRWKAPGVGATSWASPRLVPVAGGEHLVLSAVGSFVGLDPKSGQQLWRLDGVTGNSTPTPIPLGEGRFLIGATLGRGDDSGEGRAAESNGVVAITPASNGTWQADYVWRAQRATSSFGSPIAHDGLAYFVNQTGVMYGLDLETGEERFAERLAGSSWATPLGVGDRVYFFGKDGLVNIVTSDAGSQVVTSWDALPKDPVSQDAEAVSGSVLYAASWCGDLVLMRRGDRLFAVPILDGSK